jgi:4a-hydroxytetrahydrobiopterin dehydratase
MNLSHWQTKDNALYHTFDFKDFAAAFAFMTKVAAEAEAMNHHPTWKNSYNTVEVWLSTHSAGGITDKDQQLAEKIDSIYGSQHS